MARGQDQDWRADAGVCVRTPLLPLTTLLEWSRDVSAARAYLASVLALHAVVSEVEPTWDRMMLLDV